MLGALIGGGLSALGGLLGGNATNKAAQENRALLKNLKTEGMGHIDQGHASATGHLQQVGDLYSPLAQIGVQSGQMYGNALGLNGEEGNAAAQGAFQTGPGYQFAMDQGLQALERRGAAQGRLQSGQTGVDTLNYAQGLANQEYGGWMDRLANPGILAQGLHGQAGSLSDLANLDMGTSGQRVDLITGVTNGLMGSNNQRATGTQQMVEGGLGGLAKMFGGMGGAAKDSMFAGYL